MNGKKRLPVVFDEHEESEDQEYTNGDRQLGTRQESSALLLILPERFPNLDGEIIPKIAISGQKDVEYCER